MLSVSVKEMGMILSWDLSNLLEFFIDGAELSMNSENSDNLRNH